MEQPEHPGLLVADRPSVGRADQCPEPDVAFVAELSIDGPERVEVVVSPFELWSSSEARLSVTGRESVDAAAAYASATVALTTVADSPITFLRPALTSSDT